METLFLTPRHTEDAQALWRVAINRGWDVHRLATWRVPEDLRSTPHPVLYVEALFGPSIAEQLGVELLDPDVDWLPKLPAQYRLRHVSLTTFEQAQSLLAPAFVKPPNDKSFPAQVYAPGELPVGFDESMPVLVSEPVQFTSEFRCFVLDRSVRTFSIYSRNGDIVDAFRHTPEEEIELKAFLQKILADPAVELPRACVLDVGVILDRGWAVVEQNAAWGAGLYGCDPHLALDVVRFATVPRAEGAA